MDLDEQIVPWISTDVLLDRLHQFPIDFTVESPHLIVSEVIDDEHGPPFLYVIREHEGSVVVELVTVEGDVWIRQLAFKPSNLRDLEAFFHMRAQLIPSPWSAA